GHRLGSASFLGSGETRPITGRNFANYSKRVKWIFCEGRIPRAGTPGIPLLDVGSRRRGRQKDFLKQSYRRRGQRAYRACEVRAELPFLSGRREIVAWSAEPLPRHASFAADAVRTSLRSHGSLQ